MKEHNIVAGIIEYEDKITFIKRNKEPFQDTLILPGGKVEFGETLEESIEREILEETGLIVKTKEEVGYYDELVLENRIPTHRHKITIYYVTPISFDYRDSKEGEVLHLNKDDLILNKDRINPSDYRMLERVLFNNQWGFRARITVEKIGNNYRILSEENIN